MQQSRKRKATLCGYAVVLPLSFLTIAYPNIWASGVNVQQVTSEAVVYHETAHDIASRQNWFAIWHHYHPKGVRNHG